MHIINKLSKIFNVSLLNPVLAIRRARIFTFINTVVSSLVSMMATDSYACGTCEANPPRTACSLICVEKMTS